MLPLGKGQEYDLVPHNQRSSITRDSAIQWRGPHYSVSGTQGHSAWIRLVIKRSEIILLFSFSQTSKNEITITAWRNSRVWRETFSEVQVQKEDLKQKLNSEKNPLANQPYLNYNLMLEES